MENNQLITTDNLWYKIKSFFRKIFQKNNIKNVESSETKETNVSNEQKQNFERQISYRKELREKNKKEKLAKKLVAGEKSVDDLTENEIDEMTEYFQIEIEKTDRELDKIKWEILELKKQLAE